MPSPDSSISAYDASKHPQFMGMAGRKLSLAVSFVATTGFLLFGYDREL